MSGKQIRISHLFSPESGNSVTIPLDHGIALGSLSGLADPLNVLDRLMKVGIDAVLLGPGLGKVSCRFFERRDAPARILTVDHCLFSSIPGGVDRVTGSELISSIEFALRYDFDCLKAVLVWGLEPERQIKNLELIGRVAGECDRVGLPLMVEPVLWGDLIPRERKNDPRLVEHAARIALEVGADLLKIPYTGDGASFAELVKQLAVPVVVLGGPKMGTARDILQVASDSVRSGARGIVFGRNVWQSPSMEALVLALSDIVHQGAPVDTALANRGLAGDES